MPDDERPWTGSHDRTPDENLRALVYHLDPATQTADITRLGAVRIPALGEEDEHLVERIRETVAEQHAIARARRWNTRDEEPTITMPDAHTIEADDGNVVPPEQVQAAIEHRLSGRSPRACLDHDPASVIGCTGPDGSGYRWPTCDQQRRREEAILEALLDAWEADRDAPTAPQRAITDGGER